MTTKKVNFGKIKADSVTLEEIDGESQDFITIVESVSNESKSSVW